MSHVNGSLDETRTKSILSNYERDDKNTIIRHALSRNAISSVIYDSSSLPSVSPEFSLELKTLPVANQKASGRCWIFAGLNVLREIIAKKCDLKKFELSQNYISLYDKIEKANFALESILALGDRDHDDREFSFILHDPIGDGGQWDMFVNLVKKYGLMPQEAFPETFQSNNTRESDALVSAAIRGFAPKAHALLLAKKVDEARQLKEETMQKIYFMFLNAFGVPPKSFDFEYTNEKGYHVDKNLTPVEFFEKYVGSRIDEYQSIINSPTKDKPYNKNYTIDYLGNVIEGRKINHLNLPMERIKELIIAQLKDKEPVWFGSDVGFYRDRGAFAWDSKAMDYKSFFGFDIDFKKEDMLDYWHSAMNHAMVITGVNLVENVPTRWKIENSWGGDNGNAGYYVMSKEWFDTFVYQAVILKKYLNEKELSACKAEPKHLHPWDPMGTLAD
ncbi:MAG: C1 family peptidase [Bacilli bacterium]|jgi:bleomycin hydrolase|nr:C1 family peptidase [Bacilli bacterium]MCH4211168.1 C1 family peptidase [Bacilli bacterium]MCH4228472.1 C1 family peptidase [Bacilli bacterium]MCH4277594.1 C1 family peptidase [Bacilli bacterium]MCI2054933.1 C1 family peptidase [Bacilli bacterium]